MALRLLLLSGLLISHPCSTRKSKNVDWTFTIELLHSYLCTGDQDWWKNIKDDPALRFIMHTGVNSICDPTRFQDGRPTRFVDVEILKELVGEARHAVEEQTWEKRVGVSDCLWKGIRDWHIVPLFCPLPSETFMKNFDKTLDSLVPYFKKSCIDGGPKISTECKIGAWLLKYETAIRDVLRPYLCASRRNKRQFDAKSGMAILQQIACLESADFNFEYVAMKEGKHLHFATFGFWCCIIELVKT